MRLVQVCLAAMVTLLLFALPVAAPPLAAEKAILVLDASGSMWARVENQSRIEIARETLRDVLGDLPEGLELGFMAYGHRDKGDCGDIELLVEPGPDTGEEIIRIADRLSPKGKTPISAAVRQAAEALGYTEDKATVILITDGIETCEADPCELGADLERSGVDFTTHVVGFGLSDEEGQQVSCLAEETGGLYIQATDAPQLIAALGASMIAVIEAPPEPVKAPEPVVAPKPDYTLDPTVVLGEGADPMTEGEANIVWEVYDADASGAKGAYRETGYGVNWRGDLPPGRYVLTAALDNAKTEQVVEVDADDVTEPYFLLDAGRVILRPYKAEGEPVDGNAQITLTLPDGTEAYGYGETNLYVPAGDIGVKVVVGSTEVTDTIYVAPGEIVEKDFVVGVGRALLNAYYVADMKVEDGSLFVEVVKPGKSLDGTRESVAYAYGPDGGVDLAPGDYVAVATLGDTKAETPFEIGAGELTEVWVTLDAGVLALEAPNWGFTEVYSAKKDIAGNRKGMNSYFNDGVGQVFLPSGKYVLVMHDKVDSLKTREVEAEVIAGERTEVILDD